MTGLGFGLIYLPAMDIVQVYFRRNLGLATGIAAAGSGFGQFVLAPAIHAVEDTLGLEGTFNTLGAVVSFAVFFALIYRMPNRRSSVQCQGNLHSSLIKKRRMESWKEKQITIN